MDLEKFLKSLNEQEPTVRRAPAPAAVAGPAPVRQATVQPGVVQPAAPARQAAAPPPPPAPKAQGFTDAQKKEVKAIVDKAIEDFMKGQVEKEL